MGSKQSSTIFGNAPKEMSSHSFRRYLIKAGKRVSVLFPPTAALQIIGLTSLALLPIEQANALLLGIRAMDAGQRLALPPFYSLLPKLNNLRARGKTQDFITIACLGFRRMLLITASAWLFLALLGP